MYNNNNNNNKTVTTTTAAAITRTKIIRTARSERNKKEQ